MGEESEEDEAEESDSDADADELGDPFSDDSDIELGQVDFAEMMETENGKRKTD